MFLIRHTLTNVLTFGMPEVLHISFVFFSNMGMCVCVCEDGGGGGGGNGLRER